MLVPRGIFHQPSFAHASRRRCPCTLLPLSKPLFLEDEIYPFARQQIGAQPAQGNARPGASGLLFVTWLRKE